MMASLELPLLFRFVLAWFSQNLTTSTVVGLHKLLVPAHGV